MPTLMEKLENILLSGGCVSWGIADLHCQELSSFQPIPSPIPSLSPAHLNRLRYGLTFGIPMPAKVVEALSEEPCPLIAAAFHNACQEINARLDAVGTAISREMDSSGYVSYPIAAAQLSVQAKESGGLFGEFSHKLAAHVAGLGWIGKNCLLITPEWGPSLRWGTVLTDMPPTAPALAGSRQSGNAFNGEKEGFGKSLAWENCNDCEICIEACPVHALTGKPFHPQSPREERLDASRCLEYHMKVEKERGIPLCSLCLSHCPVGK